MLSISLYESRRKPPLTLYLSFLGLAWGLLIAARLIFYAWYYDATQIVPTEDIIHGLYIGSRFDGRIAALLTAPFGLILSIPFLSRRLQSWTGTVFLYACSVFFCVWTVMAVDFGFYAYLGERLNSTLFDLLADTSESMAMVWQSYPVLPIAIGIVAVSLLSAVGFRSLAASSLAAPSSIKSGIICWVIGFVIFAWAAWGQVSSNLFPLRWSNAYFSPNQAVTALALNPLQNLYDTYTSSKEESIDPQMTRDAYPLMAAYLQVDAPDPERLSYERLHTADFPEQGQPPNVVIIIVESLSHHKSSFAPGNDDPTPFLTRFAAESRYYPWFFANTRTTARAVFTTMTGIPDVTKSSTGSRNPYVIDQRIIANQFDGYDKYYMIGGNANWANIRGVLGNNIGNLTILEESDWKAPNVDVWGIADLDLLMETHELFTGFDDTPFLAVIQTASFHKPFTIPDNTPGFQKLPLSSETRQNYGFVSEAEYNSMRYIDFALEQFFAKAKQSKYYANTIFFLFGDHGINEPGTNMDAAYTAADLGPWHVPLMIHAPGRAPVGVDPKPASQVDVFPTAAALAGLSYTNYTLGRNLLDPRYDPDRQVFLSGKSENPIRLIKDEWCYFDNRVGEQALYRLGDAEAVDYRKKEPEIFAAMRAMAGAWENTSGYMLYNNKKR